MAASRELFPEPTMPMTPINWPYTRRDIAAVLRITWYIHDIQPFIIQSVILERKEDVTYRLDTQVQVHQHAGSRLLQLSPLTRWISLTSFTSPTSLTSIIPLSGSTGTVITNLPTTLPPPRETAISNPHDVPIATAPILTTRTATINAAITAGLGSVRTITAATPILVCSGEAAANFRCTVISSDIALDVVVLAPVQFFKLQEALHPLGGDPGLHEPVDHPRECIQWADQNVEQSNTCKYLCKTDRWWIKSTAGMLKSSTYINSKTKIHIGILSGCHDILEVLIELPSTILKYQK